MAQQTATEEEVERAEEAEMSKWQALRAGIFLSPEAIIMLPAAFLIDIGELFIPLEPIDPLDIFALVFFSSWMIFRAIIRGRRPEIKVSKKAAATLQRVAKWAKRLKWLRPVLFIAEFVPFPPIVNIGALPLWTVAVYLELKHG